MVKDSNGGRIGVRGSEVDRRACGDRNERKLSAFSTINEADEI